MSAIINPPGIGPVDRQGADGRISQVSEGWLIFFNQVYNICSALVQSGSSTNRPTSYLWVGKPYFDETLGQFVYWDGDQWMTAPGNAPPQLYGLGGSDASATEPENAAWPYAPVGERGLQGPQGTPGWGQDGEDGETIIVTVPTAAVSRWASFTTTRTGWTDVGAPTVTARYQVNENVCHFQVKVVPATTVATTAGTSYVTLPLTAAGLAGDATMMNTTTLIGVGVCAIDVANSRAYVPTQAATANTLTIAGWYEV